MSGPLIQAVRSLYDWCQSLVCIAGSKLDLFLVRAGLHRSCPFSPILLLNLLDRISECEATRI